MDDELCNMLKVLVETEGLKIAQIDRLFHFLQEMTETTNNLLMWLVDYCQRNNIPLWKEEQFRSYVHMSRKIMAEIEESSASIRQLIESRKLPPKKFDRRSPEDLPEPHVTLLLVRLFNHRTK